MHAKDSHILSTKNNSVFLLHNMCEIITNRLTNDAVDFEQLGPYF